LREIFTRPCPIRHKTPSDPGGYDAAVFKVFKAVESAARKKSLSAPASTMRSLTDKLE
jgi:hypothetical protein